MEKDDLKQFKDEICAYFGIAADRIEDRVIIVAEQVAANTEKLQEHDKRFDRIEGTLEIIKLDIEFIKNELKQRVGRVNLLF